ncbi:MAG: hypothetical protein WDO68_26810 [Gammaproteobacteria bacterium]
MTSFNRKFASLAGALVLGFVSSLSVNAAEAAPAGTGPMCHPETRRIAVWPTNPKLAQIPRFETRTLAACDGGHAATKPERTAAAPSFGPRSR